MAISMNGAVKRREFLLGSAAVVAAGTAWGQSADECKMKRISVMSFGLDPVLKTGGMRPGASVDDPKRTVDVLDLADVVAERYGIHIVELQHSHFASTEPAYLAEFRNRLNKAKSQMSQINVEFGTLNVSVEGRVQQLETIDLTKQWIDHAAALGCPRVMVNQGTLAPDVVPTAIETLKTIAAYAKSKNVFITMENRGFGFGPRPGAAPGAGAPGVGAPGAGAPGAGMAGAPGAGAAGAPPVRRGSATWDVLVEVLKASSTYANPDLAYFVDNEARRKGLAVMYKMTSGSSHVKYDPANFDTAECIKISKEAGYKGLYAIEAQPRGGADPYVAVKTILDVILANT